MAKRKYFDKLTNKRSSSTVIFDSLLTTIVIYHGMIKEFSSKTIKSRLNAIMNNILWTFVLYTLYLMGGSLLSFMHQGIVVFNV